MTMNAYILIWVDKYEMYERHFLKKPENIPYPKLYFKRNVKNAISVFQSEATDWMVCKTEKHLVCSGMNG